MYRSSVSSHPRHARLFSATLLAGAVCLAFVPTAHAQEVEKDSIAINLCFFDGAPKERVMNGTSYGPVTVKFETLKHPRVGYGSRPIQVKGLIIPGIHVGTREPTPEPWAGFHTGDLPDVDPGHVFALQLGGPDVAANIVPQWSKWQRHGPWRAMELELDKQAKIISDQSRPAGGGKPTRSILMWVDIHYKNTGNVTGSLTTWAFPTEFLVSACVAQIAHPNDCIANLPYILHDHRFEGGPH